MENKKVKKPFYKRVWVWVLAIIIVGAIATSGEEELAETATPDEEEQVEQKQETDTKAVEKKEEAKTYGIGQVATVADVGFTVTNVQETNVIESGNQFIEDVSTSGKFVLVDIKIDNGQSKALTILDSYFKINLNGAEYDASTSGEIMMAMSMKNEDSFFLEQINPGLSKTGTVVFEFPADADLSQAFIQCQTGAWGTETININLK